MTELSHLRAVLADLSVLGERQEATAARAVDRSAPPRDGGSEGDDVDFATWPQAVRDT